VPFTGGASIKMQTTVQSNTQQAISIGGWRSVFILLRFHFSIFLMPVYLFALGQVEQPNHWNAILIFIILHLLVYPASNGYNSYMDRDTESIGGLKSPPPPPKQLFMVTVLMDVLAIGLGFFISLYFAAGILAYILASRAYSYRGIRLKQYPVTGYLTVVLFQGAATFFLVYHGVDTTHTLQVPVEAMIASSLLIGGFYPLTQIYQHQADLKDGVKTISYVLGYRGTFIYCGIVYAIAGAVMAWYFLNGLQIKEFGVLSIFLLPILVYYTIWFRKVIKNTAEAILIMKYFE
jgi:1,4-dihydroxy-2-naphthoate polyprenyltransferase